MRARVLQTVGAVLLPLGARCVPTTPSAGVGGALPVSLTTRVDSTPLPLARPAPGWPSGSGSLTTGPRVFLLGSYVDGGAFSPQARSRVIAMRHCVLKLDTKRGSSWTARGEVLPSPMPRSLMTL